MNTYRDSSPSAILRALCFLSLSCAISLASTRAQDTKTLTFLVGGQSNAVGLAEYGEPGFIRTLHKQAPDLQINFIACAVGATLSDKWIPGKPLYENCINKAKGIHIDAVLWDQGESEAVCVYDPARARQWTENFIRTVVGFRKDLHNPKLPVLFARLGKEAAYGPNWQLIYDAQSRLVMRGTYMVSLDGIPIDPADPDHHHYEPANYNRLGERFAWAYLGVS